MVVAACNGPVGDIRGATPVGYAQPILNPLTDETADPATIVDLSETPEEFEGQLLEVSGTYYQRQVVVCSTRPQLSPASWSLSDGEARIPAGGMDTFLQSLPSGRIDIVVVGRWLRWQGPVGCGRQAQVTEVWYLDVIDVISPNPITIAAFDPDAEAVTLEIDPPIQPPDPADGYPAPDETADTDPSIELTPIISVTMVVEPPESTGTPVLLPTPSATTIAQVNPTAMPTATLSETPAATPSSTATTDPNVSPTATSTSGDDPVTVDQEELPPGSIETAQLGTNEIHRWPFVITSTAVITVNIGSEIPLDASIAIRDPSGNIVAQQNNAQDGAPEILAAVPLTEVGTYDILIASENDVSGYYAILVLDQNSYTFVFNGTIGLGQTQSTNIRENNDHFWQFFGTAGETVTIRVTPTDTSNLFLRLFGPSGTIIIDFHNETAEGEVEEILNFILPDTGIYSLLIGEFSFGPSTYSITLTGG